MIPEVVYSKYSQAMFDIAKEQGKLDIFGTELKAVRDAIQRLQRRFIIDEHRGIAAVSAGHHHGRTFLCQQDMQRAVWQKEADILIFRQL